MENDMEREQFRKLLLEENVEVNDNQLDQFDEYYRILVQWNEFMNLTAITDYSDVLVKHFLDSVSLKYAVDSLAASDEELLNKLKAYTAEQKEAVKAKAAKLDSIGYEAYLASK